MPDMPDSPSPVVVCIPTTPERRLRLQKCVESLVRYAGHPFVLCTYENQYIGAIAAIHHVLDVLDPNALVWWIGDDVVLTEPGTLRRLVERFDAEFPDRDGVVNPDDPIQNGRVITAPLTTAGILKDGTSREFFHNFADNLFTDIMNSRGKHVYAEDVHIDHHHWCNGKAPQDYTYTNSQRSFEQDRKTTTVTMTTATMTTATMTTAKMTTATAARASANRFVNLPIRRARQPVRKAARAFKKQTMPPTRESDVVDSLLDAIAHADAECALGHTPECAAAWDVVQDITTGLHKVRERDYASSDPLDALCAERPWADECRVYDV